MKRSSRAFTIVELVVVVVLIGVLAALSVVSYNAVTRNARISTLKSDLSRSASAIKKEKAENGSYPASEILATPLFVGSEGVSFQYSYDSVAKDFCLTATIQQDTYYVDADHSEAVEGGCAGHGVGGIPPITNLAYNPSVELDLSGVTTLLPAAPVIRVAGNAADGIYSTSTTVGSSTVLAGTVHFITTSGLVVGSQYTCGVAVKGTPGVAVLLSGIGYNVSGSMVSQNYGESTMTLSASWQRISSTFTIPANVTQLAMRLYLESPVAGTNLQSDAMMCVQGATSHAYRDGASGSWIWSGVPHASSSTGPQP